MKIAIISDVHANYPALLAVVNDAIKNKVDSFVFVGDYIFDLPYHNETTELIKSLKNAYVIKGNKEGYLTYLSFEDQSNWIHDQIGVVYQTFRELKPENLSYLKNLEEECYVTLPFHGKVYVTHYIKDLFGQQMKTDCNSSRYKKYMKENPFTHEQFLGYVSDVINSKRVRNILSKINASVIIFGHSHLQWHGYCNDKLIINPGSCGQPLDCNRMAPYSILEDTALSLTVEEKRVPYDIEQVVTYSKATEIYRRSPIWCELVFAALQTGEDKFSDFFKLAQSIAESKNEEGALFSNETWALAGELFFKD